MTHLAIDPRRDRLIESYQRRAKVYETLGEVIAEAVARTTLSDADKLALNTKVIGAVVVWLSTVYDDDPSKARQLCPEAFVEEFFDILRMHELN